NSAVLFAVVCSTGCNRQATKPIAKKPPVQIWGSRGAAAGELTEPRAVAVGRKGFAYVVDTTGRLHQWTTDGKYIRSWRSPALPYNQPEGPEGIVVLPNGDLAFTNTHASKVVLYSSTGKLLRSFGSYGTGAGQFLLVTGITCDSEGFIYAADYGGEFDRISKWTQNGKLVASWTGHGEGPRQFRRPCGLAIARDAAGRETDLLVADIGNHRIQRLDRTTGKYKGTIGKAGRKNGELNYPYGVATDLTGQIYTVEYGNHRVQKWTRDGRWIATWGAPGRAPGQFANPRGIAVDAAQNVYIADTMNHRVQKFRFPQAPLSQPAAP
ncbi:MAG TPA: hypothetical protein VF719_08830, partial [Abditibacteriaceae bacterium]